jgi:hypothetical protein
MDSRANGNDSLFSFSDSHSLLKEVKIMYAFNYNYKEDNDQDDLNSFTFENGEIINENELIIMELVEMLLGNNYRYCPQVPLGVICPRSENQGYLPNNWFKFWANSRVDIAILEKGFKAQRKVKLVIECQSHFHDLLDVQVNDRKKQKLLSLVKVPLIYVRRVEEDGRFYRFYTPDQKEEIYYNIVTQENKAELLNFLQDQLNQI